MKAYKFDINEGANSATLTVKANDEQSAIEQAQSLLKTSGELGSPTQVSDGSSGTSESSQSQTA